MLSSLQNNFHGLVSLVQERGSSELIKKAFDLLKREGIRGLNRAWTENLHAGMSYRKWTQKFDTLSGTDRALIKAHITRLQYQPLISILMPVYNTPERWLRQSIQSVRKQLYTNWELCIADDASTLPHIRAVLEEITAEDARIKVMFRPLNGHISAASNTALGMASGDFIALLDHDDELAEHALYHVAVALHGNPELDLIYSDEDKIDSEGRRFGHYFKPDWNLDLFLSQNLISHLGVYRTKIALAIGGFREGFEGSQDWDFALRFVERISPGRIFHLSHILYHWRSIPGSTAISVDEKTYARHAAKRALQEFWQRKDLSCQTEYVGGGHFRAKLALPHPVPKVSIVVIPTQYHIKQLPQILSNILDGTDYPEKEILVAHCSATDLFEGAIASFAQTQEIRVFPYAHPDNYYEIINCAVRQASGDMICLLDLDISPSEKNWLGEMVSHVLRDGVGAVGGMTCYPDNTVHDAGCILNDGAIQYLYFGRSRESTGYINRMRLKQNLAIVSTTCVVISKSAWSVISEISECHSLGRAISGLCLKLGERGYRNLWTPFAVFHYLGKRKRSGGIKSLPKTWDVPRNDPAWNPNLIPNGQYVQLSSPPKVQKPWQINGE